MRCGLKGQAIIPATTFRNSVGEWRWTNYAFSQGTGVRAWRRIVPKPNSAPFEALPAYPQPKAWPVTIPFPQVNPMVDPLIRPGVDPWPVARPIPYRALPYRAPDPSLAPSERPVFGPLPVPAPKPNPDWLPDLIFDGPGKPAQMPDSSHANRPPPPGSKEPPKARLTGMGGKVAAAIFAATEAIDLIDALWSALPAKYMKRGVMEFGDTYTGKLLALWKYAPYLDTGEAIANIINNAVVDNLVGRIQRGAANSPFARGQFGRMATLSNLQRGLQF